jgi:lysyl-tRNA synthetase class I
MVFKKHINIIHKSGKLYRFVNSEPISANQIQQIYDEYIRQQKVYYNNAMDKKIKTEESVEEFTLRAIKHLKDLGYKLMEPYTAYRPV